MGGRFTETLGQYLRRERESRSVSLEELSRGTRISRPFLEALERDDFQFFPQREFIVGFLKGYARHLGLDPEEVLKYYRIQSDLVSRKESFKQLPLFAVPSNPFQGKSEPKKEPQKISSFKMSKSSYRRIVVQLAIVLAAVGLSFYIHYYLLRQPEKSPNSPKSSGMISQKPAEKISFKESRLSKSEPAEKSRKSPGE